MIKQKDIESIVERIVQSKEFEASKISQDLLRYLIRRTLDGTVPTETDIARDVFDKGPDFLSTDNTLVRVHIHNVRKKLDHYYLSVGKTDDIRIQIPRGHYKVRFENMSVKPGKRPRRSLISHGILIVLLIAMAVWLTFLYVRQHPVYTIDKENFIWRDFIDSDKKTSLVIGDLFTLMKQGGDGQYLQFLRDVYINSPKDFMDAKTKHPAKFAGIKEAPFTYLDRDAAYSIFHLLPVFNAYQIPVALNFTSVLNAEDMAYNNMIFVGSFKTMQVLDIYFSKSGFSFQLARDKITFQASEDSVIVFTPSNNLELLDEYHSDYGLVSKFPGPSGNTIMLFSGFNSTSISKEVSCFTDPVMLGTLKEHMVEKFGAPLQYFEVLFKVTGLNREGLNIEIVLINKIPDELEIWSLRGDQ